LSSLAGRAPLTFRSSVIRFSTRRLTMEAIAYRDISVGEELSISCQILPSRHPPHRGKPDTRPALLTFCPDTPLNMVTEDRKQLLRRWNFDCACALCSSPERSAASDRNRLRIQAILEAMDNPENREYDSLSVATEEMMEIVEVEGLQAQVADFYRILAEAYSQTGFPATARRFAAMSAKKYEEFVGIDSEQLQTAVKLWKALGG
jgi:hypothetical protein